MGLPGVDAVSWFGLFAPAKTPPEIVQCLHKALELSLADEELHSQLAAGGFEPMPYVSARETTRFVQAEYTKWTKVIQDAGITLD